MTKDERELARLAFAEKNANRKTALAELASSKGTPDWQKSFSRSLRKALNGCFGNQEKGVFNLAVLGTTGESRD